MLFGYDEFVCSTQLPPAGIAGFTGRDDRTGGDRTGLSGGCPAVNGARHDRWWAELKLLKSGKKLIDTVIAMKVVEYMICDLRKWRGFSHQHLYRILHGQKRQRP
ncbi:MAG: hypothetical protein Q8N94_08980 [Methanoregula sp.]|nr:hypothetical protein [Methanoregula sp.]